MIRVVADLRGQVESYGESGLALFEQELVSLVGFGRGAKPCVLPHRPQTASVHVLVQAARVRKLARWRLLGPPVLDRVDGLEAGPAGFLGFPHVSTSSVSPPPMAFG